MKHLAYVLAASLEREADRLSHVDADKIAALLRLAQGILENPSSRLRFPEALTALGVGPTDLRADWPVYVDCPSVHEPVRWLFQRVEELPTHTPLHRLLLLYKLRWKIDRAINELETESFSLYNKRIIDNGGVVDGIISPERDNRQGKRPPRPALKTQNLNEETQ